MTRRFLLGPASLSLAASLLAQPPSATIVDTGTARLETVSWGDGEPVILLPGAGYSVKAFELVGPELARRGYHAIGVNPRGIGRSAGPLEQLTYHDFAADVAALIDSVAAGRAHLLGWAWGNRIARCLATDSPDRVASLTLLAAGGKFPPDTTFAALTKQLAQPGLSDDQRNRLWADSMLAPGSDVRRLLSITESWPDRPAGRPTPLSEWWSGGSAPMLVIQGLQDRIAPPANGRDLKSSYPDRVTLVEIDGAGHGLVVEHPERIADETVRFLRNHPIQPRR